MAVYQSHLGPVSQHHSCKDDKLQKKSEAKGSLISSLTLCTGDVPLVLKVGFNAHVFGSVELTVNDFKDG